jgi:putative tricarboxylic transport membrane protein
MEQFLAALLTLLSGTHFFYLCLGVFLGLVVGILPGLGGIAGLSLLLPFIYGMEPLSALALLIGLLAVVATSDTFPSILMGIPGSSGSQATVVDGFPLAKKGEGARALGAAFSASLIGGLIGAIMLTGAVFVARPVILAIGFGEQLMLVVLGLSLVGVLTGPSAAKGLATCGIGLLIGVIGTAPATGALRMTYGSVYLSDGIPLVIMGLGLFAVPEIIELLRRHRTIAKEGVLGRGWISGLMDTFRHRWLVLRCSVLGSLVGALPGLGGAVIDWISYAHAVQTSRDRANFGKGDIRGVLGPESSNNSKEGGALMPTLLFGIPGSGSMAIFLGGLILIGVEPGPRMVHQDLDLTLVIIWSLALANILGAGACLLLSRPVAYLTTIPYALVAPLMIVLVFFASFQATRHWGDILALMAVSALGVYMKRFGWPRPALLIGYVLSPRLEASVYQTAQIYGLSFLQRPLVLAILALTLISIYAGVRFGPQRGAVDKEAPAQRAPRLPQLAFTIAALAFVLLVLDDVLRLSFLGRVFPLTVILVTLPLVLLVLWQQRPGGGPSHAVEDAEAAYGSRSDAPGNFVYLGWLAGFVGLIALVGFVPAMGIFVLTFLTLKAGGPLWRNLALTTLVLAFLTTMSDLLVLDYPRGLLQSAAPLPWPLG